MTKNELYQASIIVCTYNRRKMLKECLNSLFNQDYPMDKLQIIVIDSSDDFNNDCPKEYQKQTPCNLKYLYQEPRGISSARNAGIRAASGNIICFIDDDCLAEKTWVRNLLHCFGSDEKLGGAGGKVLPFEPRNTVERVSMNFFNQEYSINSQSHIIGCNMAYRGDLLKAIGGFDENFKASEDNDMGIRVSLLGYKLNYVDNAIVYHKHRTTLSGLLKQHFNYGRGNIKLGKKYKGFPKYQLIFSVLMKLVAKLFRDIRGLSFKRLGDIAKSNGEIKNENRSRIFENIILYLVTISYFFGMITALILDRYPGEKIIDDNIELLEITKTLKIDPIKKTASKVRL